MIDYVKIKLLNIDIERLLELPYLDFIGNYNRSTSEVVIESKLVAEIHYCKITIYKNGATMFTGSIHKMYNSLKGILAPNYYKTKEFYKGFNGNDFTLLQIIEVRKYLELLFECDPSSMVFQNIEFGYNTTPCFASKLFLKGLLHHKGKPFEVRFSTSYQCKHQNIIIKIYDKAIQYGMQGNVLRTEIRVQRASELLKLGIKSFADINTTTLKKATELLQMRLSEAVYFDYTIDSKTFGTIDKRKYLQFQIPNYLIDLNSENRKYPQRELQRFIDNYSTNLKKQIQKEVDNLFTLNTWFENLEICYFSIKKCIKYSRFSYGKNQQIKNQKFTLNTISSINVNRVKNTIEKQPLKTAKCKYTNLLLNHEKQGAVKIGLATLKYLRKNDPQKFSLLYSIWIKNTKVKTCKFESTKEDRILKAIKNKYRNKITNHSYKQKLYNNPNQQTIF